MIPVGFCQCGCGGKTDLAPNTSTRNGWVKGEPLKFIRFHYAKVQYARSPSAYERVMAKVTELPNGCWDAGSASGRDWYGQVSRNGKNVKAHQVVWERLNGEVPVGKLIRHTCDNMRCCRPEHLILGTQADNRRDSVARGRAPKGEKVYNSKFTDEQIRFVRSSPLTGRGLSDMFSVTPSTICAIRKGRTWRHLL